MEIKEQIEIAVPSKIIDQIWSEVDQWHKWDPDTKKAYINGPFTVGTYGKLTPTKGMGVSMAITERTVGKSFTVEGGVPFFRMHFEHTLSPSENGVLVTHHVWFSGALSFLFGPGVAKQVRNGLPKTMLSLKAYAEARHNNLSTQKA